MITPVKSTVLIVDDNQRNIYSMKNLLEQSGRNFITVSTGKEALKLALSQSPDLIVLNLNVPDMDGFEITEILKSNKRTCHIPVLFTSVEKKESPGRKKRFEEEGVDYLLKPPDPKITRTKVEALWFTNTSDVTGARQVEVIRHYLATVVKQSGDAIYLHNEEGAIISWNKGAENIYGFTEAEALKMKIWNIIPDHLCRETQEIINRICDGEKISMFETRRITKHGKILYVLFSASVLKDEHQQIRSIAITERDITQQKMNDEKIKSLNMELSRNLSKLEVINRELESFSYSVSHDLRAPLRIINGFIKIIYEDHKEKLEEEVIRNLNTISLNAKEMEQLINGLLSFSKVSRKELVKTTIRMNDLVKEAVAQYTFSNNITHIKININTLPEAIGDAGMLRQVWTNLISNAIKYSSKKEKPEITIGSNLLEQDVMYYIKDNGVGFDMNNYERLFGVFQRLHSDTDFEGTGVGLALVKRIIHKHGGKVWAEGNVGKGAVFYFLLPADINKKG